MLHRSLIQCSKETVIAANIACFEQKVIRTLFVVCIPILAFISGLQLAKTALSLKLYHSLLVSEGKGRKNSVLHVGWAISSPDLGKCLLGIWS